VDVAKVILRNLGGEVVASVEVRDELEGHCSRMSCARSFKRAAELSAEEKLALIDSIRAMTPRRLEIDGSDLSAKTGTAADARGRCVGGSKVVLDEPGAREARASVEGSSR
jgi:hypothetical protein